MLSSIPFSAFAPFAVLLASTFLALFMANFMSHTATANLLLPLVAAMIPALSGLDSIGGPTGLILSVTFACSLGMSLPISTPPNAMAMATGAVRTPDMAKVGIVTGIAGLLLSSGMFWLYNRFGIL